MKQVLLYTCYVPKLYTNPKSEPFVQYSLIIGLILLSILLIFSLIRNSRKTKINNTLTNNNHSLKIKISNLEEVNEVKDKLFSIVSHDLKDSILSIKTLLDLFKEDEISKDEFNELIPELSKNANNASSLLLNLLNWSKSQMQNLQPKPVSFDIKNAFQTKIALIEKKLHDKGIIIVNKLQNDFVYADQSMVEIIIQNLITNAIKFSGKGDTITISNKHFKENIIICVEDTGIGISQKNIEKLFDSEKKFTTIGTQNEKGNGLGLSICKDLVELNNGAIWAESTPNIGSKFFIELPKSASEE